MSLSGVKPWGMIMHHKKDNFNAIHQTVHTHTLNLTSVYIALCFAKGEVIDLIELQILTG